MRKKIDLDKDGELKKLAEEFRRMESADDLRAANDAAEVKAVESKKPLPTKNKPAMFAIIGVALVASLVLIFSLAPKLFNSAGRYTVPDVTGKHIAVAQTQIDNAGLRARVVYDASSKVTAGTVIEQKPVAGTRMTNGDEVRLIVSGSASSSASTRPSTKSGKQRPDTTPDANSATPDTVKSGVNAGAKVAVPDVIDVLDSKAKTLVEDAGLKVVIATDADASKPDHMIIACDPKPGTQVERGSTVRLTVNTPPARTTEQKTVTVENYYGRTSQDAINDLRQRGLSPTWTTEPSRLQPSGYVIRTEPAAGARIPLGGSITVVIAK